MKNKKVLISFVVLMAILIALSSIIGILSFYMKDESEHITIYGDMVKIYGGGIYKNHTTAQVYMVIPHDIVNLFIALPALIILFIITLKNSEKAKLFFLGVVLYFLFTYMIYTFYAFYNALFICYVAIMGLSFYTLVFILKEIKPEVIKNLFKENYPNKLVGRFLLTASTLMALFWLKTIASTILTGYIPKEDLAHSTTLVTHAIDLGFVLPLAFIMGIGLCRKKESAYIAGTVIPVFLVFMMTAVFSKGLMLTIMNTTNAYPLMIMMGTFGLVSLIITIVNFKYMKK